MFITENAEQFQFLKIHSFMQDQDIFVAVLQGFNATKWFDDTRNNYLELQKKKNMGGYKYILKGVDDKAKEREFRTRYPIYDTELAKYEVAINETIINSKIYRFKQTPESRKHTVIIHYYLRGKYMPPPVFQTWQYALEHCKYLTYSAFK